MQTVLIYSLPSTPKKHPRSHSLNSKFQTSRDNCNPKQSTLVFLNPYDRYLSLKKKLIRKWYTPTIAKHHKLVIAPRANEDNIAIFTIFEPTSRAHSFDSDRHHARSCVFRVSSNNERIVPFKIIYNIVW